MPRITLEDLSLNVETEGDGPPLLLLHGFTGSALNWRPFLPALGRRYRVLAVDLPGHGLSDAPPEWRRYRFERCIQDLTTLLDRLGVARTHLLGYSMGGRVALSLALAAPERVASLVLESTSPGLSDPSDRRQRLIRDMELAAMIEREGIRAFVDYWERLPLWETQKKLPSTVRDRLRQQRLANNPRGLANSLRGLSQGRMPNLSDRLSSLEIPVLLVAGALDDKYRGLAEEMNVRLPASRRVIVPGAGHNVHLEKPRAFERLVLNFLDKQELQVPVERNDVEGD